MLLTYATMCSQYQPIPFDAPSNYKPTISPLHSIFISAALFLCLCFTGQLTGAHVNPIVTLTFMVNKNNKVTIFLGSIYIFSQFFGAIVGGAIGIVILIYFSIRCLSYI